MEEGLRRKKQTGYKREMKLKLTSIPASNGSSFPPPPNSIGLGGTGEPLSLRKFYLLLLIFHSNTSLGSCQVFKKVFFTSLGYRRCGQSLSTLPHGPPSPSLNLTRSISTQGPSKVSLLLLSTSHSVASPKLFLMS